MEEEEIERWSCTDRECSWNKEVKQFQKDTIAPIPLKRFCHGGLLAIQNINMYPEIDSFENSVEFNLIMKGSSSTEFRNCYVHV
jgi:hypothetical protein